MEAAARNVTCAACCSLGLSHCAVRFNISAFRTGQLLCLVSYVISLTMLVLIFMDIKCSYAINMVTSKTTGVPKYKFDEKEFLIFKPVNFGHKI